MHGEGGGTESEVCVVVAPGDAATASTGAVVPSPDNDNDTKPLFDIET